MSILSFWIKVEGRLLHLTYRGSRGSVGETRTVWFCQCSKPPGACEGCSANLIDALDGPWRQDEQAVWCTKCGRKYPFVANPSGCAGGVFA